MTVALSTCERRSSRGSDQKPAAAPHAELLAWPPTGRRSAAETPRGHGQGLSGDPTSSAPKDRFLHFSVELVHKFAVKEECFVRFS